jgi:very-short-patch-repair endonuclease
MTDRKTTPFIRGSTLAIERRASELRRQMTSAESKLWQAIRRKQLDGLRFRAQHPVGRFILDFYCPEHKLVVEVDGSIHEDNKERDEERTACLAAFGYIVVRVQNSEIETNLSAVLKVIRDTVNLNGNSVD